jgi:hypothetical protein
MEGRHRARHLVGISGEAKVFLGILLLASRVYTLFMITRPHFAPHYHKYSHILEVYGAKNAAIEKLEETLNLGVLNLSMTFLYGKHIDEGSSIQQVVHKFLQNFDSRFGTLVQQYRWLAPQVNIINALSYEYTKSGGETGGITVSIDIVILSNGENITEDMRNMFMTSNPWSSDSLFPERCNVSTKVMYLKEWLRD